jgi:hypothetical protein
VTAGASGTAGERGGGGRPDRLGCGSSSGRTPGAARPELVLGDPVAKGVARDPELPGGARHVPEGIVERLEEPTSLGLVAHLPESPTRGGWLGRCLDGVGRRGKGQHGRRDDDGVDHEGDTLHRVRQFADVPAPRMREERRARVWREGLGRQAVLRTGLREEVLGKEDRVVAALPEGRQVEGHDREPVIEILAEVTGAHRGQQVLVARGDDPDVNRLGARGAEPTDGTVLQDLQELGLEIVRQHGDLVEKERASVRRLEQAGSRLPRIRECPPLKAEHLGLEQGLGDRGTVRVDERLPHAWARVVEGARQQALADARLPLDEHGRQPSPVRGVLEQPGGVLPERLHGGRVAE